ncbi:myosin-10 [Drosophila ficusphila]|uniref:myosin-10 n=1 Tax=Drosophila ficusphila TaxID=30025 RepID=UPI0007E7FE5F|nr:myosin-10 [Drosophila ficusphila]
MPFHDRAKARLEHEVTLLRREVAELRSKQEERRRTRKDQAALQAHLEHEIELLKKELASVRNDHHERERGGAEQCSMMSQQLGKLDDHVTKQEKYIAFLEEQISHTRTKYKERMSDVRKSADLVEKELQRVRHQMKSIAEQAGEVDNLQQQLELLNEKLERRNSIISKYEAQQEEMVGVLTDLQRQLDEKDRCKGGGNDQHGRSPHHEDEKITPRKPSVRKDKHRSSRDKRRSSKNKRKSSKSPPLRFAYLSEALKHKLSNQDDLSFDS